MPNCEPIRIVHTADLHLGVESYGRIDGSGLSSRLGDFLSTFDTAVDWAVSRRADLFVVAGDVYKNRDPSPTIQRAFAERMQRLTAAGVPVHIITGNHDLPNSSARADTVAIFATLQIPLMTVRRSLTLDVIATAHGPLQIISIPWVTPHDVLDHETVRNLGIAELHGQMLDYVESYLDRLTAEADPTLPLIIVAHGTVVGAALNGGTAATAGGEMTIPYDMLAGPGVDYVAMGHLHRQQVIRPARGTNGPPVVYSGSLERVDFGEEGETKGFMEVSILPNPERPRRVVTTFHPVAARPFRTLQLLAEGSHPQAALLATIEEQRVELEGAVVRVEIRATPDQDLQISQDELARALRNCRISYLAGIQRKVDRPNRTRIGSNPTSDITPAQALELYVKSRNLSPDRAELVIAHGLAVMGNLGPPMEPPS